MKYEILDDAGNVTNIIIATPEFAEQHYAGHYREVVEPPPPPVPPVLSKYEFLKRFTSTERKAITAAAAIDPDIADFKLLLDAAQEVDCGNEDTVAGVNALEAGGILAPGRAAQILAP